MKHIVKELPPADFTTYRRLPNASYKGLTKKKNLYKRVKQALAKEQGFICCYCGRRISGGNDTQIEHIYAKGTNIYEEMQLDYETNLVACCDGGKNERHNKQIRKEDLFCESVKGDKILPVNPLMLGCEDKFLYAEDGDILGLYKDGEVTIKILNLTSPIIKNMRKYAIRNYLLYPPQDWDAELQRLQHKDSNGQYEEFCFVLESYIKIYHQ